MSSQKSQWLIITLVILYSRAADELTRYIALNPKAPDADKIRGTIKDLRSRK